MKVSNKKCIFRLSYKNMKYKRIRNLVAIIAVSLTTLLFTALFTIILSISKGFEYSNFRQIGTMAHGEFKALTEEQYGILKSSDKIEEFGLRRTLGIGADEVLLKNPTEISYMDENTAKWGFVTPTTGRLPKENTTEAAADTRLLNALGVPMEIGTEFSVTIDVDGKITTEDFVLCGWWEHDPVSPVSNILVPESKLDEVFEKLDTQFYDENIGSYFLNVMLKSSRDIAGVMIKILADNGYSSEPTEDNYIRLGINWGYTSESLTESMDVGTSVVLVLTLLLIMLTGYLIIYNVFRISVSNEIRHYGMLKTIGTTGRQIRSIILIQATLLSLVGIPIGLLFGWGTGAALSPIVINELNIDHNAGVSANPVIFVFSAVFSVLTVLISCFKPGKIAASVSPIEALRYTEASVNNDFRKGTKGISIPKMAAANLLGSKGKTALTVISLSLSVVLFTVTVTFANSFSMEKYLSNTPFDFQVADATYFRAGAETEMTLSADEIEFFKNAEGVTGSFCAYGTPFIPETFYSEEHLRSMMGQFGYDESLTKEILANAERDENGLIPNSMQLLGMDSYGLDKITVIVGDISKLSESGYIAVSSNAFHKVGDSVTIRYTDNVWYENIATGSIYTDFEVIPIPEFEFIEVKTEYHDAEYEICALVEIPHNIGYRYYTMGEQFLLDAEDFQTEVKDYNILYVAFDVADGAEQEMEQFLSDYTQNSTLDYSSRAKSEEEFENFRKMFVILGGAMSFIVGLVGILNFINTVLTGIISRRRELATLQAIGMTGKQLKSMLIFEGLYYIVGVAATAIVFNLLTIPLSVVIEKIFWFCDYQFTMLPTAVAIPILTSMGIVVPIITYAVLMKKSVVERLRECE